MATLTLNLDVPDTIIERFARLHGEHRARIDEAVRRIVNETVSAAPVEHYSTNELPVATEADWANVPTWEELTGFTEEEEEAFNRLEGHYPAFLSVSVMGQDASKQDEAWKYL